MMGLNFTFDNYTVRITDRSGRYQIRFYILKGFSFKKNDNNSFFLLLNKNFVGTFQLFKSIFKILSKRVSLKMFFNLKAFYKRTSNFWKK